MNRLLISVAMALALSAAAAGAQTIIPIEVTQVSLATPEDATRLPYYVLDLPAVEVPAQMRLAEALLEFYMDATSTLSPGLSGGAVTLEVYPFGGTTNGKLDVSNLPASSMKRTVAIGTNRSVRVYVTDFLERLIDDPTANRSLIAGSVTGTRVGRFEAKAIPGAAGGVKATLTVYFSRIEEARVGADG